MLLFNLLPPEKKIERATEKQIRVAVVWGWSVAALLLFFTLLLLPSYFVASFQHQEILRNLALTEESPIIQRIADIRRSLTALKQNAFDIEKISKETGLFSAIIADIVGALPQDIIPTAIQFDGGNRKMILYGLARRRNSLVALEQALRELPRVEDVSVPLSDLVQNIDIPFSITITIKK